jgi:hypothetical protein
MKLTAFTFAALHPDFAMLHLYQHLRNAKAQSGTAEFPGRIRIGLLKRIEDFIHSILVYTNSGIRYSKMQIKFVIHFFSFQRGSHESLFRKLNGIANEIDQNLT